MGRWAGSASCSSGTLRCCSVSGRNPPQPGEGEEGESWQLRLPLPWAVHHGSAACHHGLLVLGKLAEHQGWGTAWLLLSRNMVYRRGWCRLQRAGVGSKCWI